MFTSWCVKWFSSLRTASSLVSSHCFDSRLMDSVLTNFAECKLAWVCSLILVALPCGCSSLQRQGELKGEVFIVTKGGGKIKLGLVEISISPEEEINSAIEKKKPAMDSM